MTTTLLTIGGLLATIYLALCALLYFSQDDFIFFRVGNDPDLARQWQAQRVTIPTVDTTIEGWWVEHPNAANDATVIYFGGNAEDVLYSVATSRQLGAKRFLTANYRGYGGTPGEPSEAALDKDALALFDYAIKRGVAPESTIAMGRSLGSGVATYLAAHRPVRGVILVTPYDSLASVAQTHYRLFPVQWLLRHRFASIDFAPKFTLPALIVAADSDTIVPPAHAKALFDAWGGPKNWHLLAGVGHNDIDQHPQYFPLIQAFLAQRPR